MFYRKIEEARQFFGFTNIYIIDTVLMMFCAFEGHTFKQVLGCINIVVRI